MSVPGALLNQENIIKKVFDEVTNSLRITGSIVVPPPVGAATEAKQDTQITLLTQIESNTASSSSTPITVKQISALVDTSATNITVATPVQIFSSLSSTIYKVQIIEDIGEYMVLCVGAPGSEVNVAALPLGGGEVEITILSGSRVSVRSLVNTISNGKLIINALGNI
jgi:hypothetical protein